MFSVLEGSDGGVLGVEISEGYTPEDVEAFKKAFEERIAGGHDRVNLLVKIDRMEMGKSHLKAFVADAMYALKVKNQLRHVAVVGDSAVEKFIVAMDNKIMGNAEKELIEKYFNVAEIDKAWTFVRG